MTEATTLTRKQLHALVWETPMTRLATRFGISDNGLRKICHRLEVPCPPAGWWARRAAGKTVVAAPLPPASPGVPGEAVVSATPAEAGALKQAIHDCAAEIGEITMPDRLVRPHPLIAGWIEDHRRRRDDARRHREQYPGSRFSVPDLTEAQRRQHRILNTLFRTLEQHGAEVEEDDRRHLHVVLDGQKIEFGMHEKSRQVARPLTTDEKRWGFWDKAGVRKELEPTGRFEFQIRVWIDQPVRKTWLETENKPLERMLPEIIATFLELGPVLAERARKAAEAAKVWAERQRQLELERQRREQDDKRWARFVQLARASDDAETARSFIARLRQLDVPDGASPDDRSLPEWLEWAEDRARAADPIARGLADIFGDVAKVNAWSRLD